ncbi:hypothetical protein MMC19_004289 [Ptychographa xylographoides]|nr:hypothetical protein [Ptychographa xylographoides]
MTDHERSIVELHDQLNEIRLERTLLNVQLLNTSPDIIPELSNDELESQLKKAERECLEARAAWILKTCVVEDVLSVDPLLKGIHSGANASPIERALHPLIDQRDVLTMTDANLSATLRALRNELTSTEVEHIQAMHRNQKLTALLLSLTNQLKAEDIHSIQNRDLQLRLGTLREDVIESKRRWRIMKSLVAAVVASSGIDWAHHSELLELVLDDE